MMLTLKRCEQETIHIGDDIKIVVAKCSLGHVKLAIEAPAGVLILRGELVEQPKEAA